MLKGKKKQLAMLLVALGLYSQANAMAYVNTLSPKTMSSVMKSFESIFVTNDTDTIKSKELLAKVCGKE